LEYNDRYCISVYLLQCRYTTDFVYALFRPHATHVCEWNMSWKVLEKRIFESWKTLEFGLYKYWKVLEKKHFNVCTNTVFITCNRLQYMHHMAEVVEWMVMRELFIIQHYIP